MIITCPFCKFELVEDLAIAHTIDCMMNKLDAAGIWKKP